MSSDAQGQAFEDQFPDSSFTVTPDFMSSGPIVVLKVDTPGAATAEASISFLTDRVQGEFKATQASLVEGDASTPIVDAIELTAGGVQDPKIAIVGVEVAGKTPLGPPRGGRAYFAAGDFPVGKSKVKVKVAGLANKLGARMKPVEYETEVEVERKPLGPHVQSGYCLPTERFCVTNPHVDLETGNVTMVFEGPKGTKVEVAGKRATLAGFGAANGQGITFEQPKSLLASPLDAPPTVTVKVTSPDGISDSRAIPVRADGWALKKRLKDAEKGPVRFAGEARDVGPSRLVAFYPKGSVEASLLGKGKLSELELVALEGELPVRSLDCGTYVGERSGRKVTITNVAYDAEVRVYERKTGRLVQRRTIPARMPACESSISSAYSGSKASANPKDVAAFAASLVR